MPRAMCAEGRICSWLTFQSRERTWPYKAPYRPVPQDLGGHGSPHNFELSAPHFIPLCPAVDQDDRQRRRPLPELKTMSARPDLPKNHACTCRPTISNYLYLPGFAASNTKVLAVLAIVQGVMQGVRSALDSPFKAKGRSVFLDR
jgi:hypothetical protein